MKEKEKQIISFYGVIPQLKYMQTEMFEFIEAVINYDLKETMLDEFIRGISISLYNEKKRSTGRK